MTFIPDRFFPDEDSFVPASYHNTTYPAPLAHELTQAIMDDDPGWLYGLFKRFEIDGRIKTHDAQARLIHSLAGKAQAGVEIWKQAKANQRLPLQIKRQEHLEDLTYKHQILSLTIQEQTALAAFALSQKAAEHGLSLELYLKTLDKELELKHEAAKAKQDSETLERNKAIERHHEHDAHLKKIAALTRAKNEALRIEEQITQKINSILEDISTTKATQMDAELKQGKLSNLQESLTFWKEQRDELRKRFGADSTGKDI